MIVPKYVPKTKDSVIYPGIYKCRISSYDEMYQGGFQMTNAEHGGNKLFRSVAFAAALIGGSATLGACTGERPSFDPPAAKKVTTEIDCPSVDFEVPGADLTPDQFYQHYQSGRPEANLSLTDIEYTTSTDQLRSSMSIEESQQILSSLFEQWDINIRIAEVPKIKDEPIDKILSNRPQEVTQHLLDVSARHILDELSAIPKPIMDVVAKDGLDLYLTTGIQSGDSNDIAAMYFSKTNNKGGSALVLDVGPGVNTGKVFLWGLASALPEKLCGENSTYSKFASYNPIDFHYGTEQNINTSDLSRIISDTGGEASLKDDITVTLKNILDDGMDSDCRPFSGVTYANDNELVSETTRCEKQNYILQVVAAKSKKAARYLANPYYYAN